MRIKGVTYDVGRVLGGNWRPVFDPQVIELELEVISRDLHCNTVRICSQDISRLETAAEAALHLGLDVWLSPELWNKDPDTTLHYIVDAASMAERLQAHWPGRIVFCLGSELTLFMRGVLPGRSLIVRVRGMRKNPERAAGAPQLTEFVKRAVRQTRTAYSGPVSYASLVWEAVDWSQLDFVGVDHYRDSRVKDQYIEKLQPMLDTGKPVVITEFGMRAYAGADTSGTLGFGIVQIPSLVLHELPLIGHFVRTRLKGNPVRDEDLQAREIAETLRVLDEAGVEGAFVHTFVDYRAPTDADPRYDLDMSSFGLVKLLPGGKGVTYPGLPWEPKAAFSAVEGFYAAH